MTDERLEALPCPACRKPVFAHGSVVLCSKCDAYQHLSCWTKRKGCSGEAKCKGKSVPVAVVKLEPPHPTADEISAIVEQRLTDVVHPLMADLRSVVAHGEDLDALRRAAREQAESSRAAIEEFRRDVEGRLEKLRQLVAAMDQRESTSPQPLLREDLSQATREANERADAADAALREAVVAEVGTLRRSVAAELHGILLAVEACRWDTAARRHPLPWDGRTDDVLAPAPHGRDEVGQGE